ncbi:MAG TPA: winged helix-turn-helix domain-containing protein [Acidimicrobiales bacterium]|nr:winged helix-turn-helix domain-containing protein [Acidimicrobiales bacterium]
MAEIIDLYGPAVAATSPSEGLWLDPDRGIAGWGDRRLPLSPQEVAVLVALLDAHGRVVPRAELVRRLGLPSPRRCDSILVGLRRVLGPGAVLTVRGRGWRFDADLITPLDASGGSSLDLFGR